MGGECEVAELPGGMQVHKYTVPSLKDVVTSFVPASLPSPLAGVAWPPQPNFVSEDEAVVTTAVVNTHKDSSGHEVRMLPRAGPTEVIAHDPSSMVAAIVTCGG